MTLQSPSAWTPEGSFVMSSEPPLKIAIICLRRFSTHIKLIIPCPCRRIRSTDADSQTNRRRLQTCIGGKPCPCYTYDAGKIIERSDVCHTSLLVMVIEMEPATQGNPLGGATRTEKKNRQKRRKSRYGDQDDSCNTSELPADLGTASFTANALWDRF